MCNMCKNEECLKCFKDIFNTQLSFAVVVEDRVYFNICMASCRTVNS